MIGAKPEKALITACGNGDLSSFKKLLCVLSPVVYDYLVRRFNDLTTAKVLLPVAFLRLRRVRATDQGDVPVHARSFKHVAVLHNEGATAKTDVLLQERALLFPGQNPLRPPSVAKMLEQHILEQVGAMVVGYIRANDIRLAVSAPERCGPLITRRPLPPPLLSRGRWVGITERNFRGRRTRHALGRTGRTDAWLEEACNEQQRTQTDPGR